MLMLMLMLASRLGAAELSPAKLLAAGRVDDAIVTLQNRITAAPNDAESQNLLCRAYFVLTNWDAGVAACMIPPGCVRLPSIFPGTRQDPPCTLAGWHSDLITYKVRRTMYAVSL